MRTCKRWAALLLVLLLVLPGCGKTAGGSRRSDQRIPWVSETADQALHYYFMASEGLDVGGDDRQQKWGDSCLVVFPNGQTMLIDCGESGYAPLLLANLERLGVEKLDYLVFSHPHSDHCYGAVTGGGVLEAVPVGQVYHNGTYNANWGNAHIIEEKCQQLQIPCAVLRQGDTLEVGGVGIEVLWPKPAVVGQTMDVTRVINDNSLVLRFVYGRHTALFCGDLYMNGENQLVKAMGDKLDVDLLKIPHHGGDTSSSQGFAAAVTPKLAVATGYQMVPAALYRRYTALGSQVLMDLYDGYVHVTTDGVEMRWETAHPRTTTYYERYEYAG